MTTAPTTPTVAAVTTPTRHECVAMRTQAPWSRIVRSPRLWKWQVEGYRWLLFENDETPGVHIGWCPWCGEELAS